MATPAKDDDGSVRLRLSDLLDRVLVRAENGYDVQEELRKMASTFEDPQWTQLLARAQCSVRLVIPPRTAAQQGRKRTQL